MRFLTQLFLTVILFLFIVVCNAQPIAFSGKVVNSKLEPLGYASVQIKEMQVGTITDDNGKYKLMLPEGKFDLVISLVGYETQKIEIIVEKNAPERIIILASSETALTETKIVGFKKDRANEIMKSVVAHKEINFNEQMAYHCNLYIKAVQQDSIKYKKKKQWLNIQKDSSTTQQINLKPDTTNRDLQGMALAEIALGLDFESPNKIKETRAGVRKYGNIESLFYLTTTDGDFNFYRNLVSVKALSVIPFLSPVSYSGLIAYRFKMAKVFYVGKQKYYTIKISPMKLGNALVSGDIDVMDSTFAITRTHFEFPNYHMVEYDYFAVDQQYDFINQHWMITKQTFTYFAKVNHGRVNGYTTADFMDYHFVENFSKKHFTNELSVTTDSAYHQDTTFWQKIRTEPLSLKEVRFIHYKDSVYEATHSKKYLDSLDHETNRITPKKLLWDGLIFYKRSLEREIDIGPITGIWRPFFLGGSRLENDISMAQKFKSKKSIFASADVSYGLRNKDWKGTLSFGEVYNPFTRGRFLITVGKNFDLINENEAWINLLQRSNYYENQKINISHSIELVNGLRMNNELEFAARRSVDGYKLNPQTDSLFGEVLTNNKVVSFASYNAFYNSIRFDYTPEQKYLREPKEKIILGSRFPTFYVLWRKGIPTIFNSTIDFDYLEFGIYQHKIIGIAGLLNYSVKAGRFLSQRELKFVDNKFIRRGDPYLFSNPIRNFQSLDSSFAVYNWFYEAHVLHEFNGALLNKVPLVRQLKLLEVAGGGLLYVPERNLQFVEVFGGLEKVVRIFRDKYKFGVYVVASAANKNNSPLQFKIGVEQYRKFRNSWVQF